MKGCLRCGYPHVEIQCTSTGFPTGQDFVFECHECGLLWEDEAEGPATLSNDWRITWPMRYACKRTSKRWSVVPDGCLAIFGEVV